MLCRTDHLAMCAESILCVAVPTLIQETNVAQQSNSEQSPVAELGALAPLTQVEIDQRVKASSKR